MEIIVSIQKQVAKIFFYLINKMNILLKALDFAYGIMMIVIILMNAGFPRIMKIGKKFSVDFKPNVMIQ